MLQIVGLLVVVRQNTALLMRTMVLSIIAGFLKTVKL